MCVCVCGAFADAGCLCAARSEAPHTPEEAVQHSTGYSTACTTTAMLPERLLTHAPAPHIQKMQKRATRLRSLAPDSHYLRPAQVRKRLAMRDRTERGLLAIGKAGHTSPKRPRTPRAGLNQPTRLLDTPLLR